MKSRRARVMMAAFLFMAVIVCVGSLRMRSVPAADSVTAARDAFSHCIVASTKSVVAAQQLTESEAADLVGVVCSESRQRYADSLKAAGFPDTLIDQADDYAVAYVLSAYRSH